MHRALKLILILFSSLSILAAESARSSQNLSPDSCATELGATVQEEAEAQLKSLLKRPNTLPKDAIRQIIVYINSKTNWDGDQKHKEWQKLTHTYNQRRANYWINSPFLRTHDGHIVCWGETRGHLLIFRSDGKIFLSYNPNRPDPHQGAHGYKIDWTDPTLRAL